MSKNKQNKTLNLNVIARGATASNDLGMTPEQIATNLQVPKGLIYGFLKVLASQGLVKPVGTRNDGGKGTPQTLWKFSGGEENLKKFSRLLQVPPAPAPVKPKEPKEMKEKGQLLEHPIKIFQEVQQLRQQLADANSKLAASNAMSGEVSNIKRELAELKQALGG